MGSARHSLGDVPQDVALVVRTGLIGLIGSSEGAVDVADLDLKLGEFRRRTEAVAIPRERSNAGGHDLHGGPGGLDLAEVIQRIGDQEAGREPVVLVGPDRRLDAAGPVVGETVGAGQLLEGALAVARGVADVRKVDEGRGRGAVREVLGNLGDAAGGREGAVAVAVRGPGPGRSLSRTYVLSLVSPSGAAAFAASRSTSRIGRAAGFFAGMVAGFAGGSSGFPPREAARAATEATEPKRNTRAAMAWNRLIAMAMSTPFMSARDAAGTPFPARPSAAATVVGMRAVGIGGIGDSITADGPRPRRTRRSRSLARPRDWRLLTVPIGQPSCRAASSCERPSRSQRTTADR